MSSELPQTAPSQDSDSLYTVPEALLKGTTMTKVSERKQKRALFQLDPDQGLIIYKTSWKTGIVALESVKEIRSGDGARYYREQFELPRETENRWLTIIYTLEGAYKTLHMLADTQEDFSQWESAIRKLVAVRQGLMIGLGNVNIREEVWSRQYWKGADANGDRQLSLDEIEKLSWRLNARFPRPVLQKMFDDADTEKKGYLDYTAFQTFVRTLKRRPEIEQIYKDLCDSNGGKFDFPAFDKFLSDVQHSSLTEDERKFVFAKYSSNAPIATATTEAAPPAASEPPVPDAATPSVLTLEGFSSFLLSPENAAFDQKNQKIWQDMTRPVSEYFISASHNTYLVGHQLIGVSTIEGYIRALLHSCRSVELDIYDGEIEPVVFHGKTFTSKVPVRDICNAIAKYAFMTSPYPVLISAEIHCSVKQQDLLVKIMTDAFGDALIRAPVEGRPRLSHLPSPEDLKGKILVKAKNLYVVSQLEALRTKAPTTSTSRPAVIEVEVPSDDSDDEEESTSKRLSGEFKHGMQELKDGVQELKDGMRDLKDKWRRVRGTPKDPLKPKQKIKMSFDLASLLVYTVGVKCHGFGQEHGYAPEHIFSLSENKIDKFLKTGRSYGSHLPEGNEG
ncbi:hypothetical protein H0H93_013154 [Arthromyces matolae]|nr:hypothetical protein H0H93_013154 [Arthromyces matolae]